MPSHEADDPPRAAANAEAVDARRRSTLDAALEDVTGRFAAMLRRVAYRHRLSAVEVDETVQEVRIRLWRALAGGETIRAAPASYVYRTAMSAALDILRRRRRHRDEVADADALESVAAREGADAGLEAAESAARVARAVDAIVPTRRAVVRMYLAGYDREEIAELLGWSEAKTRNLLYRGLAELRAQLGESTDSPPVERRP